MRCFTIAAGLSRGRRTDLSRRPSLRVALVRCSAVFMLMTFVVFAGYGLFAAAVRDHVVHRPVVVDRVRRLFAASFLGLGVKLATTER